MGRRSSSYHWTFFTVTCQLRGFKIDFLWENWSNFGPKWKCIGYFFKKRTKRSLFCNRIVFPKQISFLLKSRKAQMVFSTKIVKKVLKREMVKKCFRRHIKWQFLWNAFPNSWKAGNIPVVAGRLVSEPNGIFFRQHVFVQIGTINSNMKN